MMKAVNCWKRYKDLVPISEFYLLALGVCHMISLQGLMKRKFVILEILVYLCFSEKTIRAEYDFSICNKYSIWQLLQQFRGSRSPGGVSRNLFLRDVFSENIPISSGVFAT